MLSFESSITPAAVRMTSREIAELLESRHDSVKRTIERLAESGVISQPPLVDGIKSANGVVEKIYVFTGEQGKRDSIVVVAQLSPEFTARLVDRWQALEAQLAATPVPVSIPDFSNPAAAARAWADQYEARLVAEKTKAQIGSKREATAMARASAEARRAEQLSIELDRSHQMATIKRVEMTYPGHQFCWRMLKAACRDLGISPVDVFDANYGSVKAYPAAAWKYAYDINMADLITP